jgi:hypothetical protein
MLPPLEEDGAGIARAHHRCPAQRSFARAGILIRRRTIAGGKPERRRNDNEIVKSLLAAAAAVAVLGAIPAVAQTYKDEYRVSTVVPAPFPWGHRGGALGRARG